MDKRCSKCDILKPASEYYTYYHSVQQKYRTRNVCNTCFKDQKKKYKESIKKEKIIEPVPVSVSPTPIPIPTPTVNPLSLDPMYQKCRTCQEYVHYDGYYHHKKNKNYLDCKKCSNNKETNKKREQRLQQLEEQGGSEKILTYPNQYMDEYQKIFTFKIMQSMGWSFNEEKEIWVKPGVKDENGVWDKIKNRPIPERRNIKNQITRLKRSQIKDIITKDNLPKLTIIPTRATSGITEEIVNNMMYDYFINKIKLKQLELKYNYDYQMIGYYVDKIYSLF